MACRQVSHQLVKCLPLLSVYVLRKAVYPLGRIMVMNLPRLNVPPFRGPFSQKFGGRARATPIPLLPLSVRILALALNHRNAELTLHLPK